MGYRRACVGSSSVESADRAAMVAATSGNTREMMPTVSRNRHERALPNCRIRISAKVSSCRQLKVALRCSANQSSSWFPGRASTESSATSRPMATVDRTGGTPCNWMTSFSTCSQPLSGSSVTVLSSSTSCDWRPMRQRSSGGASNVVARTTNKSAP